MRHAERSCLLRGQMTKPRKTVWRRLFARQELPWNKITRLQAIIDSKTEREKELEDDIALLNYDRLADQDIINDLSQYKESFGLELEALSTDHEQEMNAQKAMYESLKVEFDNLKQELEKEKAQNS